MSKQTFNATTLLVPISCSKHSILRFLLRTLEIIGIIWIFLVCSSEDFASLKSFDTSVSSSDIGNNWNYLDFSGLFIGGFAFSKHSILRFLLRTLRIIGIIWIFLVCSSWRFAFSKHSILRFLLRTLENNWDYLDFSGIFTHRICLLKTFDTSVSSSDIGNNWDYLDFSGLFIWRICLLKRFDTSVSSSDIGNNWDYLDFSGLFIGEFAFSKHSILRFLLRTLRIIGIIWIFLVCSPIEFALLKTFDTSVSSSDIENNWDYLDFSGLFIGGFPSSELWATSISLHPAPGTSHCLSIQSLPVDPHCDNHVSCGE